PATGFENGNLAVIAQLRSENILEGIPTKATTLSACPLLLTGRLAGTSFFGAFYQKKEERRNARGVRQIKQHPVSSARPLVVPSVCQSDSAAPRCRRNALLYRRRR